MIPHVRQGLWPISKRLRTYVECEACERTQTASTPEATQGLSMGELTYAGWAETPTGWLCPMHSDMGPSNLKRISVK